jgi:hypothetical protein
MTPVAFLQTAGVHSTSHAVVTNLRDSRQSLPKRGEVWSFYIYKI